MIAVYDLKHAPVTFDFLSFLAVADCTRQLMGHDGIDLYIVAGEYRQWSARDMETSDAEKEWRIYGILLESTKLLPSIQSVHITRERPSVYDFPAQYHDTGEVPYLPKDVVPLYEQGADPLCFKAPAFAEEITPPCDVTLTLRTSRHFPERNVDLDEWYKFHQHLKSQGKTVLVIPDQEDPGEWQKYDWKAYLPAAYDIRLRFALYEQAEMNYCSANGPCAGLFYSNAPYSLFDSTRGVFSPENYVFAYGQYGGQHPWALPNQCLKWADSSFTTLTSDNITDHIPPTAPAIKKTRITKAEILDRTRNIMDSDIPSLKSLKNVCHGETAIIVGGGPSLADHMGTLRKLSKKRGHKILCTNKTYDYLIKRNFDPWAVVLLDPLQHVADYVKLATPETRVFLATQCHPDTWKSVEHTKRYHWIASDNRHGDNFPLDWMRENYPDREWVINGGGNTGGLRAIYCAYELGFRDFHLIGFDSSMKDGSLYAYDKEHPKDAAEGPATLEMNGHIQEFYTNEHMAKQVENFEDMLKQIFLYLDQGTWEPINMTVYGDGMLPSLAAAYGLHADPEMNKRWAKTEKGV